MSDYVDATFYVQVEAEWAGRGGDTVASVRGAKAVNLTQSKPSKQKPGTVLTKLTIRVPKTSFLPLRPEAVVVIPEGMTLAEPIQVEAGDPSD